MRADDMPQHDATADRRPAGASHHAASQDLAMLTRANHDMRSPLSVILGVFELLEDTAELAPAEARFVSLGHNAARDLLAQADALRLYSALQRNLVTLETGAVDIASMAKEHLDAAFADVRAELVQVGADRPAVNGDAGYLGVALTALCSHLAAHVPPLKSKLRLGVETRVTRDGRTVLAIRRMDAVDEPATHVAAPGEDLAIAVLNAITLVGLMGGEVAVDTDRLHLCVTLPSVPPKVV